MNPQQPNIPVPPQQDTPKPVAYDTYGRPLYAHPPSPVQAVASQQQAGPAADSGLQRGAGDENQATESNEQNGAASPQVVYMTRAVDPHKPELSEEIKVKHAESAKRYPFLNLSEGEYVISAVRRHPIGLFSIWGVVVIAVLLLFIGLPLLLTSGAFFGNEGLPGGVIVSGGIMLLLAAVLFILGGVIATIVYKSNRFYLTNESVIQHIQTSLFSKKDQTISLNNVEDASYRQKGLVQSLLNYGSIRLSTEGEETTYRFNYVSNPKKEIDVLNNAVEAFKNFRPVDSNED
jgi:hypothetical protein